MLNPNTIEQAYHRIKPYIHRTPLMTSSKINDLIGGHNVYFKCEMFQKIGAFKVRGALNALLKMQEDGTLPQKIVTVSSGNHAQAVAFAAQKFNIPVTIFMAENSSKMKIQATQGYGGTVVLVKDRFEAEQRVNAEQEKGAFYLPPFDHDDILTGQGTSCFEALQDLNKVDAIFATCGGGGWLSGTYLAKELLCPTAKVIGCEPELADDATRSYRSGEIVKLTEIPQTIADGARTPAISPRTFEYLKKCDDFMTVTEEQIIYWTNILQHYLKTVVEPTSAVAMAGLQCYIAKTQPNTQQTYLVLLSGGNVDF